MSNVENETKDASNNMYTFKVFDQEADLVFDDVLEDNIQSIDELEAKINLQSLFMEKIYFWCFTVKTRLVVELNKPGDFKVTLLVLNDVDEVYITEIFFILIQPAPTESRDIQNYFKK